MIRSEGAMARTWAGWGGAAGMAVKQRARAVLVERAGAPEKY